jgi:multidrug efflux pump subunit AcrA (membrane-fusion protein)
MIGRLHQCWPAAGAVYDRAFFLNSTNSAQLQTAPAAERRKFWRHRSCLLTALLCVLPTLSACTAAKEEEEPEVEPVVSVEVTPVARTSISMKISAEAVLYPIQQASIVPKITAPVRVFRVEKGAKVREGQVLAELESQDLASAVAENQAEVDQAEATYQTTARVSVPQEGQKAELDLRAAKETLDAQQKRYDSLQELYRQGAIAQKEVNDALVTLTQARNQYEIAQRVLQDLQGVGRDQALKVAAAQRDAAKARLQSSQTQLGYARIVSPISGVVTDRPLYAGETASSDKPLITVMDLSSVIARAHVPQESASEIKVGSPASLLVADEDKPLAGKVTQISPALDPSNTTVEVWVQAANPDMRLRAGTSARVEIVTKTIRDALVVPESSIVMDESGEKSVIVVEENDHPRQQTVSLGIHDAGNIQVTNGLKEGQRVVSGGAYDLSKLEPDVLKKTKLQIQRPKEQEEHQEK